MGWWFGRTIIYPVQGTQDFLGCLSTVKEVRIALEAEQKVAIFD